MLAETSSASSGYDAGRVGANAEVEPEASPGSISIPIASPLMSSKLSESAEGPTPMFSRPRIMLDPRHAKDDASDVALGERREASPRYGLGTTSRLRVRPFPDSGRRARKV